MPHGVYLAGNETACHPEGKCAEDVRKVMSPCIHLFPRLCKAFPDAWSGFVGLQPAGNRFIVKEMV